MRLTRAGRAAVREAESRGEGGADPTDWARQCAHSLVHMRAVPRARDQWRITVGLAPELMDGIERPDLTDATWLYGTLEHDPMRRADAIRVQRALREVIAAQIALYSRGAPAAPPSRLTGKSRRW